MSRRIDICPTCKGKGEIIVDNWLTEKMAIKAWNKYWNRRADDGT